MRKIQSKNHKKRHEILGILKEKKRGTIQFLANEMNISHIELMEICTELLSNKELKFEGRNYRITPLGLHAYADEIYLGKASEIFWHRSKNNIYLFSFVISVLMFLFTLHTKFNTIANLEKRIKNLEQQKKPPKKSAVLIPKL